MLICMEICARTLQHMYVGLNKRNQPQFGVRLLGIGLSEHTETEMGSQRDNLFWARSLWPSLRGFAFCQGPPVLSHKRNRHSKKGDLSGEMRG